MKIYKLSQTVNNQYDTYDSCVVYAESREAALAIHPDGNTWYSSGGLYAWAESKDIVVEYLGTAGFAASPGVILASFNAG